MHVIDLPSPSDARAVLQSRDPSVLSGVKQRGVAAALWQRDPSPDFSHWISELPAEHLPQLNTLVGVDALESCVQASCDLVGTPVGPERDMLAGDIAALGFIMSGVMETPLLRVRLSVVQSNPSQPFQVGGMSAQLFCTYRGIGMQLAQLGAETSPMQVSLASAVLLRGRRWPGQERTAVLHRCPSGLGTDEIGLHVAIEPVETDEIPQTIH